jgi:hypothetical protein
LQLDNLLVQAVYALRHFSSNITIFHARFSPTTADFFMTQSSQWMLADGETRYFFWGWLSNEGAETIAGKGLRWASAARNR